MEIQEQITKWLMLNLKGKETMGIEQKSLFKQNCPKIPIKKFNQFGSNSIYSSFI